MYDWRWVEKSPCMIGGGREYKEEPGWRGRERERERERSRERERRSGSRNAVNKLCACVCVLVAKLDFFLFFPFA